MNKLVVSKVAVLGAGVMGAQIAAHFANCNHEVLLFDLPGRASAALKVLTKLKPSPIANAAMLDRITACDYEADLTKISACDWIVEAVAEDIKIKADLYNKIQAHIKPTAILTTNTSGISLHNLAEVLPQGDLQSRFCGVHFFNPPRYQKLIELIPHSGTDPKLIDALEDYTTRYLGKGSIRAKDTPNFIANRIGVFSMLATMHYAHEYKLSFDTVDVLTGELIGRPKSGTFRTADVVGLDTLANVINTLYTQCANDPWHKFLQVPEVLADLISKKCLGQKTQKGFYTKEDVIKVLDPATKQYMPTDTSGKNIDPRLLEILKIKSPNDKFQQLKNYSHPQAQFLWACFREVWHYSAYHLSQIADNVRDIDEAIKWGFGWQLGPFETWQAIGWAQVNALLNADINNNMSLTKAPLPVWVTSINKPYDGDRAYSPSINTYRTSSDLPVYNRQAKTKQNIILENDSAKLWSTDSNLVFSLKTKLNVIDTQALELLDKVIDYVHSDSNYNSLVIWQDKGDHFSAGADLKGFMACVAAGDFAQMERALSLFQTVCQRLRYASFPVVAAVKGLALGGGCELMLHCDTVVAAVESYVGLVEVGVGVLPSGGGCKEMALRANQYYDTLLSQKLVTSPDKLLEQYFMNIATAQSCTSAHDALDKGYLRKTDVIIANPDELLYVACHIANTMAQANYRAPIKAMMRVSGPRIKANIFAKLANFKQGNFISEHDYLIAGKIANVLSGGDVDTDSLVTEEWLLKLERDEFIALLKTPKTQDRINYMLTKGKPLRN